MRPRALSIVSDLPSRPLASRPLRLTLCALGLLALLGCSKDKDKDVKPGSTPPAPDLGEPIGAELPERGATPSLSLAIAVSKGNDPVAVMPKVVGHVSSAVAACPAFVSEEKDIVALNFTTADGKMKMLPRAANDNEGVKCVSAALDGKEIGTPSTMNGRVEIKVGAKAP